jgi:hypothetical protein
MPDEPLASPGTTCGVKGLVSFEVSRARGATANQNLEGESRTLQ